MSTPLAGTRGDHPAVESHREPSLHVRFWSGIQIAIAVSCSIELLQYFSRAWGSYRLPDINDLILNGLGAGLGLALVFLLRLRRGTRPAVPSA